MGLGVKSIQPIQPWFETCFSHSLWIGNTVDEVPAGVN